MKIQISIIFEISRHSKFGIGFQILDFSILKKRKKEKKKRKFPKLGSKSNLIRLNFWPTWNIYQYCCINFIMPIMLHNNNKNNVFARSVHVRIAVLNDERDIGTYTIRAVDDPRTLNKILYIKPSKNIYSFNEVVALWEKKIGKTLEKFYLPEDQLLNQIAGIYILYLINFW